MNRREIGKEKEKVAEEFLKKNGYEIIGKNFSTKFGEIDLIAKKDDLIVFVEVRSKSYSYFGKPFETIDRKKIKKIVKTAQIFIQKNRLQNYNIRFDVISVENNKVEHIPSAFDLDFI